MKDIIIYQDKKYIIRQLFDESLGVLTIASTILQNKLINEGNYSTKEAEKVDEKIFFYIAPNKFQLQDNELFNYLNLICK